MADKTYKMLVTLSNGSTIDAGTFVAPQGPKGDTGTIPEALPQEASALKNGNLPTSGWTEITSWFWEGNIALTGSVEETFVTNVPTAYNLTSLTARVNDGTEAVCSLYSTTDNVKVWETGVYTVHHIYCYKNGDITVEHYAYTTNTYYLTALKSSDLLQQTFAISDTSITANSDVLMELTDDGGVKSYSMEAGKITVIRDTVPTSPIPYTYKVKQTNASGQFTLVNHFVPSIPESPTSLPITYKKVSGSLPTSGWNTTNPNLITSNIELHIKQEETQLSSLNKKIDSSYFNYTGNWQVKKYGTGTSTSTASYISTINGKKYRTIEFPNPDLTSEKYTLFIDESGNLYRGGGSSYWTTPELYALNAMYAYAISDADITANTSVKMYLTDEGGVKAQSKASGSITVIRDSVPTVAIPYEYEVEETSEEGLFEVINAYAPTKTSELTNDSGFITVGEWQNWSDTSVLTEEGLYEIVTTEYPSDGNKTLFVQYEQGKPNNGACWVSVTTENSISVVSPICSGDGTLRVERRLANSSGPADLLTFRYRKIIN